MKQGLLLVTMCLTVCGYCTAAEKSSEPPRLTQLRESWIKAKKRDAAPIIEGYRSQLINLRKLLTEQNNLEGAVLVDAEIKTLNETDHVELANRSEAKGQPDLVTLATAFNRAMEQTVESHDKTYAEALTDLQGYYSKIGSLEGALAVKKELESVGAGASKEETERLSDKATLWMIGSWGWMNFPDRELMLKKNGTGVVKTPTEEFSVKWIAKKDLVEFTIKGKEELRYTLQENAGGKTATMTQYSREKEELQYQMVVPRISKPAE